MKQYVEKSDLDLINFILERGADVRITKTSFVVRILSEDVKVMIKKEIENLPDSKE